MKPSIPKSETQAVQLNKILCGPEWPTISKYKPKPVYLAVLARDNKTNLCRHIKN